MATPLKIGLDLDGVIIDHVGHKLALARERGFELEPWQTNSNVMDRYIPDDVYGELKEQLYGQLTLDAPPVAGAFDLLADIPGDLYIVSARRVSSIRFAQDWMMRHRLFEIIPAERIFFCTSKYEKRGHCEQLGLGAFVDDQVKVLHNLPPTVRRVLFDEHRIADKIAVDQQVEIAPGWPEIARIARRYGRGGMPDA